MSPTSLPAPSRLLQGASATSLPPPSAARANPVMACLSCLPCPALPCHGPAIPAGLIIDANVVPGSPWAPEKLGRSAAASSPLHPPFCDLASPLIKPRMRKSLDAGAARPAAAAAGPGGCHGRRCQENLAEVSPTNFLKVRAPTADPHLGDTLAAVIHTCSDPPAGTAPTVPLHTPEPLALNPCPPSAPCPPPFTPPTPPTHRASWRRAARCVPVTPACRLPPLRPTAHTCVADAPAPPAPSPPTRPAWRRVAHSTPGWVPTGWAAPAPALPPHERGR